MKTCIKCKLDKPNEAFHQKLGKPQARCKFCRSKYMAEHYKANSKVEKAKRKAWYENNKLRVLEKGKENRRLNPEKYRFDRRLKKYDITKDQYFQKLKDQNNSCGICSLPFTETPSIDHCHETGLFRGLLHDNCNTGFGLLKENIAIFESCIEYAKKYKK